MTDLSTESRHDVDSAAGPLQAAGSPATAGTRTILDVVVAAAVVVAIAVGVLERLWLLTRTALFGDTAVVGLVSQQIQHGHQSTFFWNQAYGGVEPYLVAAVNSVVPGPFGLNLTSGLLSGLAALLVGLIVTQLCADRRVGWLAGAMAWVWPYAAVWNSTRELGFHFVSLVLGLAAIFLAVRVDQGHTGNLSFLSLGLAVGLGFWASPEVVYFALPIAIVLVGCARRWLAIRPLVLLVSGVVVGALPWIYTNATTGFGSLSTGVAQSQGFAHRLDIFVHEFLPLEFSLKHLFDGTWIGGSIVGRLLFLGCALIVTASVAGAVWIFVRRRASLGLLACAAAVVAFPLLMSANSKTVYWVDDRYAVDLSYLVIIVVFATASLLPAELRQRTRSGRHASLSASDTQPWAGRVAAALTAAVCAGTLLTVAQAGVNPQFGASTASLRTGVDALFAGWHNPNQGLETAITNMHRAHITRAYADYWTAYNIDYLDSGIVVTPSVLDLVRSQPLFDAVTRSRRPAWLFASPAHLAGADRAFGDEEGPGPYTESSFIAALRSRGIGATVVHLGILDAVVPDRKVTRP
jgi:hypothetical protein